MPPDLQVAMANREFDYHSHRIYDRTAEIPFEYVQNIGSGAIGVVDEVEGTAGPFLGRSFARKIIRLVDDPKDRKKELDEIENEIGILKKAHHAHIVHLVTTYQFKDNYAIVMDPRADSDLERVLGANIPEAYADMPSWFGCLLSGLAYAHEIGISHRDIKPQNILIKNRRVLLSDFGISMMGLGKTIPTTLDNRPRGRSPEYCAPEVEQGHTRRRSADVFSLGAIFLEMATVCCYPEHPFAELEGYRGLLMTNGRQSYALNVSKLDKWFDSLNKAPSRPAWHAKVLDLCGSMLQENQGDRPKPADLRSKWLRAPPRVKAEEACECLGL